MAKVEKNSLHDFVNGEVVVEQALDQNFEVLRVAVNDTDATTDTKIANAALGVAPDRSIDGIKLKQATVGITEMKDIVHPSGKLRGVLGTGGWEGNPIAPNLLPNSSFRLGKAFWTGIDDTNFAIDNGSYGEGGILTYKGGSTGAGVYKNVISTADIPVRAGQYVVASADMYSGGMTAGTIYLQISFLDVNKIGIGNVQVHCDVNTNWKRYSYPGTVPAGAVYLRMHLYVNQNTTITGGWPAWRRIKVEISDVNGTATPYTAEADLWPSMFPGTLIPGLNAEMVGGKTPAQIGGPTIAQGRGISSLTFRSAVMASVAQTAAPIYTVPAGKKAIVMGGTYWNNSGGTTTIATYLVPPGGTPGVTNQIMGGTIAGGSSVMQPFGMLAAGGSLQMSSSLAAFNVTFDIAEMDAAEPVVGTFQNNVGTAVVTLYTCPAGKSARLLALNPGSFGGGSIFNTTASAPIVSMLIQPAGGAAVKVLQIGMTGNGSDQWGRLTYGPTLGPGDSFQVWSTAAGVNVWAVFTEV